MIYIILAMLFYTVALLLIAAADRNLNIKVATAIINGLSAIVPAVLAIPAISRKGLSTQKFGLTMAILGGTCIALFGLTLAKSFSLNKVGIVTPIVFGGSIVLTALLSTLVFKEKLHATEITGLVVMTAGIAIVIYARATAS